jgi:tetratricopeptide (TPR) repeat protein
VERAQKGDCVFALSEVEEIVHVDPHNFPALSLAGECLRDVGKHEAALAYFRRAAAENPRSAVPLANEANSLLQLGHVDEAIAQFRLSLALDPSQPQAAVILARVLEGRRETAEALNVLDAAIAAGCRAPMVFLERGQALAESGHLAEALDAFQEASRRNPGDAVARENAARAAFGLSRFADSARIYEDMLRVFPQREDIWKTLGAVYVFRLDDKTSGARAYREALRLEHDPVEREKLEVLLKDLEGHGSGRTP